MQASLANVNEVKMEFHALQEKMSKVEEENAKEAANMITQMKIKDVEIQKLSQDLSNMKENLKQEENSKILTELKRDEMKSKLMKFKESFRTLEESKKGLENDNKALMSENKNAAAEIKKDIQSGELMPEVLLPDPTTYLSKMRKPGVHVDHPFIAAVASIIGK